MAKKFPIGKPVSGKDLIGREKEINQIFELLKDGHSVILIAPRRLGKTSIILEVMKRLQKANFLVGDVDIFDISSKRELAEKIMETTLNNDKLPLRGLFKAMKENITKVLQQLEFRQIIDEYEFILGFGDKQKDDEDLLDEALEFPQKYAVKKGKNFIMAIDEFSDLVKLNGEALIKKMRARFQRQSQMTYLFAGSQEGVMNNLFINKAYAFYRFGRVIYLGMIDEEIFRRYITDNFYEEQIELTPGVIEEIFKITGCHPYYTQLLCHLIYYSIGDKRKKITLNEVEEAYEEALAMEGAYFDELWAGLMSRKGHTAVIKSIASGKTPYETNSLSRQNIHRVVISLTKLGYISKRIRGAYEVINPLFKEYIRRKSI